MSACSGCQRELPEGALFCPDCGVPTANFGQASLTSSHFNSGITSTSPVAAGATAPSPEVGSASPPPAYPEGRRRSSFTRRGVLLAAVAVLAFLLVATTFEAGLLGSGAPAASSAINSAGDPMSGEQLFAAYFSAGSQAAYANKTVYVEDSLDSGVVQGPGGRAYSSIAAQTVLLFWSNQAESWFGQLTPGAVVLAKCEIQGGQAQPALSLAPPSVVLRACDVISVASQSSSPSAAQQNND